jgi:methionyl-tRNA formyltransferase
LSSEIGPSGLKGTPGDVREESGRVVAVAGGGTSLELVEIQREGKNPVKAASFLAGLRGPARFGASR